MRIKYSVPAFAPEQGRISVNGKPFDPRQFSNCSMVLYWLACGQHKKATDEIKRAVRKARKQHTMYITYGYDTGGGGFVYIQGNYARLYDTPRKLRAYKEAKQSFANNPYYGNTHTARLGAGYKVQEVSHEAHAVDLNKPVCITLHDKSVFSA